MKSKVVGWSSLVSCSLDLNPYCLLQTLFCVLRVIDFPTANEDTETWSDEFMLVTHYVLEEHIKKMPHALCSHSALWLSWTCNL